MALRTERHVGRNSVPPSHGTAYNCTAAVLLRGPLLAIMARSYADIQADEHTSSDSDILSQGRPLSC